MAVAAALSVGLALASWRRWVPVSPTEMLGALAGAWGTWLTARQSLWNWPVGIAGSVLFAVLFFRVRLYGAMGMQLLYVALGALGWYWWLRGGPRRSRLMISRSTPRTGLLLAAGVALFVPCLALSLRLVHDAAPGGDALALSLNLAAQYLVTQKKIEHWHVSIVADVVSISLFCSHGIYLLATLLVMHVGMCFFGLRQWHVALVSHPPAAAPVRASALV